MCRLISLCACIVIFSKISVAFTPITSLKEADYVGSGAWISSGGHGDFRFYVDMHPQGWTIAQFEMAGVSVYKTTTTIDSTGFMQVEMLDESDPSSPLYYPGYGSCGVDYCQMTMYLVNAKLWKQLTFNADNTISVVGSITYDDQSANVQWRGSAVMVPDLAEIKNLR